MLFTLAITTLISKLGLSMTYLKNTSETIVHLKILAQCFNTSESKAEIGAS